MADIGFLYNCSLNTNPGERISPSLLNRVALVDSYLRERGHQLLFYSPKQIRYDTETLLGYRFEAGEFVPASAPVPVVNGNWTYQTRRLLEKGMGYQAFVNWTEEAQIGVYVPLAFSELVGNKTETYALVRSYHESLHPHSEPYRNSVQQLQHFVETAPLTFIKPRSGNKGDRIVTLRREKKGFSVSFYESGKHEQESASDLESANEIVGKILEGKRRYLIQQGIEILPYGDSVFDIRVVMLYDGDDWNWLHEARLSAPNKDLSNVSQGGRSVETEALLFDVLGGDTARSTLDDLKSEAFGLAAFLEKLHPGDLMEIAFDFVVDTESRLHLLEINTKPGLVSIGFEKSIYEKKPEDEALFERWVLPHARSLAKFLSKKLERS